MSTSDPRIDQYIAKAPPYAQPILIEVRARVRQAVPEAEETIKWRVPFFVYGGKLLASMAAFKNHAKIAVWGGGKPTMIDVITIADLPGAPAFRNDVKAAAKRIDGDAPLAAPWKEAAPKKATAKKTTAKKATAKKTGAKKVSPKKASAKKTVAAKSRKPKK